MFNNPKNRPVMNPDDFLTVEQCEARLAVLAQSDAAHKTRQRNKHDGVITRKRELRLLRRRRQELRGQRQIELDL